MRIIKTAPGGIVPRLSIETLVMPTVLFSLLTIGYVTIDTVRILKSETDRITRMITPILPDEAGEAEQRAQERRLEFKKAMYYSDVTSSLEKHPLSL